MKFQHTNLLLTAALLATNITTAQADLPHEFTAGTPARAAEVNENFNSLDQRLTNVESSITADDYSGFGLPYAASGEPRNVIVLKSTDVDDVDYYHVRIRYQTDGTLSIQGGGEERVVDSIGDYVGVSVLSDESLASVSKITEGFLTSSRDTYWTEYSDWDPSTLNQTIRTYSLYTERGKRARTGAIVNSLFNKTEYEGSSITSIRTDMTTFMTPLASGYEANNISFDDASIRIDRRISQSGSLDERIRVQGIGTVERIIGDDRPSYKIIYYRIDGQSEGSLNDTPFAAGQALDGLFF